MFIEDSPFFFHLLDKHFDIQAFIPSVFTNAFYQHLGWNRTYPLTGFLSALILQRSFPSRPIPCSSFFFPFAKNFGISAVFLKSRIRRSLPCSDRTLRFISSSCSVRWSISLSLYASLSIRPLRRC